jgi:hypothetical protein
MSGHIDEAYWIRTKAEIPLKSYKTIWEFITCFKEVMSTHYDAYLRYSVIPSEKDRKFGRRMHKSEPGTEGKHDREHRHDRDNKHRSSYKGGFFGKRDHGGSSRKLNAVRYSSSDDSQRNDKAKSDSEGSASSWDNYQNDDPDLAWVKPEDMAVGSSDCEDIIDSKDLKQDETSFQEEMNQVYAIGVELNKAKPFPVCIAAAVYGDCYREKTDVKHSRTFSHSKADTAALAEKIYARLHERFGGKKPAYSGPPNSKVDLANKGDTRRFIPKGNDGHAAQRVNNVVIKSKKDT